MKDDLVHQLYDVEENRNSRQSLADALRKQIVDGRFRSGDRLPTRDALVSYFSASKHTVQAALAQLGREGFVVARTKAGTFVAEFPPHLTRYALVFPLKISRSRFYEALRESARRVAVKRGVEFVEYVQETDDDMARLRDDARANRLAGAVFIHAINQMWASPMMTEPGAPKVLIQSSAPIALPDLHVDMDDFYLRAFELAREAGRSRLAVIYGDVSWSQWHEARFVREAAAFGLRIEPYWLAPIGVRAPAATVAFAVRALLAMQGDRRPDALIIADDNYLLAAAGGLMSSEVRVPRDLMVIAHTNYPMPVDAPGLPVTHLGFDTSMMLDHAVAILAAQREQQPIAPEWLKPLPAQTPDQLEGVPVAVHAAVHAAVHTAAQALVSV